MPQSFVGFLSNYVDVYRGRLAQEAVYGGEIQILAPIVNRSPAENHLGEMLRANKLGDSIGNTGTLEFDYLSAEIFGEAKIGGKDGGIFVARAEFPLHMNDVKFGIHPAGHAGSTSNEILA